MVKNRLLIALTFLIALMLDVLPLPGWVTWLWPEWVLLVLIYWVVEMPDVVGIATAFAIGILLDLLNGALLGEHAFAFMLATIVVIKIHQLLRAHSSFQQMIVIFLVMLWYQVSVFALQGFIDQFPHTLLYWLSVLTGTVLWPWVFILLRDFQHMFLSAP